MPSTFSSNLKIEIIPTGEQSGTWGITTNDNFSNVFETAIVGRITIDYASDANKTITTANSVAAQDFRNVYLNLTSSVSLSATRELIVPTINKNYVVQNNTTGGQSITVKTSAGTGVTVPNGRTMAVYVNGTDVIAAFDYLPSMTLGAATISGNVSLGTTSANTLSIASTITSNLIFTDNTYDIGASGATRPRNLFLAGNATIGGNVGIGGTVTLGDNSADTISVNGTIVTNLIFTDNTYDIGASGATRPRTGYFGTSVITPSATISGLTSGRVPYASTGGLIVDSNNLTFNGTTLSVNTLSLTNALAVASGGTGNTAAPTAGALVYGNGTNYAFTTTGTPGQVLISGGTGAPTWTSISVSEPVGTLVYLEGSTAAPSGYLLCDGSVYSQATYPSLYAVVGTIANNPYIKSQTTNTTTGITGIGPLPSGQYAYGNSAGVIGRSTDGGITYNNPSYITGTSALLANILTTNPNSTLGNIIYASNGTAQYSFDGITYIAQGNGSAGVNALFTDGTTLGISFGATDYGTRTNWGSFSSTSAGYSIRSVARFNSTTFVFVGTGGNIQTATGLNRAGATSRTSGTTSDIFAVTVNTDSQFYVYGGAGGVLGTSTNGITWTVRSSGTSSAIRALAYGNSLYVYGGDGGALATSTDGITWTAVGAGYNTPVFRIVYGSGRFVAATSSFFLTSTNGTTWQSAAPDISSGSVTGLEFMPGYGFVGATSSGVMLRSFDGLVWTQYSSYTTTNITQFALTNTTYAYVDAASRLFYGTSTNAFLETLAPSRVGTGTYNTVAFGNGVYVYASSTNNILVARSRLGHKAPIPLGVGTNPFVFFANGLFLAGANGGSINISTDGIRWFNTGTGTTSNITALGFGNGLYLYGTAGGGLATSTDGNTWTARTSGITNDISDFAYGGGRYVGVCAASGNIITSTDGVTWTVTTTPSGEFISQVVYGSGRFVSNTTNASNTWLTSTNGLTWSNIGTLNLTSNTGLGTDGTNFVIATAQNYVTSTNGVAWSAATQWIRTNGSTALSKLVYDGTNYVGAWSGSSAANGVSFTSSNGTTWEFSGALPFVNSGGGRLAVSGSTIVFTMAGFYTDPISGVFVSTNGGQSWRSIDVSAIASNQLRQVSFVNGAFFAQLGATTTSPLYTSTNGITWSAVATTGFASLTYNLPMQYQNGIYLLATTGGRVFTSTNSTAWTERSFPVGNINAITSALGRFYCSSNFTVGNQTSNTYYSSTDGINWELYQGATTTSAMTVADYNATANLIAFAGASGTLQATKPVTYNTATQFAVPIQRYPELTGNGRLYIKAS